MTSVNKDSFGKAAKAKDALYVIQKREFMDEPDRYKPDATHQLVYAGQSVITWGSEAECENALLKSIAENSDFGGDEDE